MFRLLAALVFLWSLPALAENMTGPAKVIDGDTIEIQGQRVRLFGIDAPEDKQTCQRDGQPWRCGKDATFALADKIGVKPIECEPKGKPDRYGRAIAVCRLNGEDLNAWLVFQGWALAYRQFSLAYVPQENEAKEAKRGVWASEFIRPWKWRAGERQ